MNKVTCKQTRATCKDKGAENCAASDPLLAGSERRLCCAVGSKLKLPGRASTVELSCKILACPPSQTFRLGARGAQFWP